MEDDEIVILASDSDSDTYEELFSCSASSPRFIRPSEATNASERKSVTNATGTSSKLCPFISISTDKKEQIERQLIYERNIEFQTQDQNGDHYFVDSRNHDTNSKTDDLSTHGGYQNGHLCKTDVLCDLKKVHSSPSARNDIFLSYTGTRDGICNEEVNESKNERSCQITNNLTMNPKGKVEENGTEPSTSSTVLGFVNEKFGSVTVSAAKNTFEELFEDDIQMALSLSLQRLIRQKPIYAHTVSIEVCKKLYIFINICKIPEVETLQAKDVNTGSDIKI
ncbi:hypothetical protein LOTGIDRAFT_160923 [Lottia gigantea]|uniref:Uncharacterized protein n=1 Tax=Lottia gigantea TaxID=225164 RepID=V4AE53_LOTGI|nr:hypothetical protein LOTGIDRAFT_160923 [Lottia gigantea]ESO95157.1 hypothetical protein LOTGIDRAFT_160923 [Lottia gigantea]